MDTDTFIKVNDVVVSKVELEVEGRWSSFCPPLRKVQWRWGFTQGKGRKRGLEQGWKDQAEARDLHGSRWGRTWNCKQLGKIRAYLRAEIVIILVQVCHNWYTLFTLINNLFNWIVCLSELILNSTSKLLEFIDQKNVTLVQQINIYSDPFYHNLFRDSSVTFGFI